MKRIQVLARRTMFDPAQRLSFVVSTAPVDGVVWAACGSLSGQGQSATGAIVSSLQSAGYQLWQVAA